MTALIKIAKGHFIDPSEVAAITETPLIDVKSREESVHYVEILFKSGKGLRLVNITAQEIVLIIESFS